MSISTSARFGMFSFPEWPGNAVRLSIHATTITDRSGGMITREPIGHVRSSRSDLSDDNWGGVTARIEPDESLPAESLAGIEAFSHAEVVYHFDRVSDSEVERGARHPRGNTAWPKVGIFAQRRKGRPNRPGATIVEIVGRAGRVLTVTGPDAIDGT